MLSTEEYNQITSEAKIFDAILNDQNLARSATFQKKMQEKYQEKYSFTWKSFKQDMRHLLSLAFVDYSPYLIVGILLLIAFFFIGGAFKNISAGVYLVFITMLAVIVSAACYAFITKFISNLIGSWWRRDKHMKKIEEEILLEYKAISQHRISQNL